eukprot:SM000041S15558  [mRNA]  locus=s41:760327:766937:- [translate_table: standard]
MAIDRLQGLICMTILAVAASSVQQQAAAQSFMQCNAPLPNITRGHFPDGFVFGTATSAYQVEGAASQDGRGQSIWDVFSHTPGKTANGATGDTADEQYYKYLADIAILTSLGADSYRFSISWSRILPNGYGEHNEAGLHYYNSLINNLVAAGIRPAVTLFHWDLPNVLQEAYGGWLSDSIVNDFAKYADLCFQTFGDRVKTWITLNEPQTFSLQGYATGGMAPGRCTDRSKCNEGNSSTEPYIAAHNQLLAHAAAASIYRQKYQAWQGGNIGITLDSQFLYPATNSSADIEAAERALEFSFAWFADPFFTGDYPAVMRQQVQERLPYFSSDQVAAIKGSIDFLGLNLYTASYAQSSSPPEPGTGFPWTDNWTGSSWLYIVPQGLHDMVLWINNRYNSFPIIVTENGVSQKDDPDASIVSVLCDLQRVDYYSSYLSALATAIQRGANVKGYYAWSLLDNFEWARGYSERFGLYYVDFTNSNLPRIPKQSAIWWSAFLANSAGSVSPLRQGRAEASSGAGTRALAAGAVGLGRLPAVAANEEAAGVTVGAVFGAPGPNTLAHGRAGVVRLIVADCRGGDKRKS